MSRPKTVRRIADKPIVSGFKPYGAQILGSKSDAVFLLYEEYEALRLCDYDEYNQCDASKLMGVSRPTLTRICMSARKKVATAMVEGRQLIIEGGKVEIDNEWIKCNDCHCYYVKQQEENDDHTCPLCGSENVKEYDEEDENGSLILQKRVFCGHGGRCSCHRERRYKKI